MSFLDEVRDKRQKLADVLADEDYSGIREIVEELYPDRAHFIYELLQNAEDAEATEANFTLTANSVLFEHDGRAFNEKDVWAITNIGKGTKKDQEDKIGRFGIGFKAVFAYTEIPHVWSPTFSFKISNLVLPWAIPKRPELDNKTRFEFPFNTPKKAAVVAYKEIQTELETLANLTLLFLTHLKSIRWHIGSESSGAIHRIPHPENENHIELLKEVNEKTIERKHFLRFSEPMENPVDDVEGQASPDVSIAFASDFLPEVSEFDPTRPIAEQMKIVPATGQVAVYFPAVKEDSRLRFHLHAPFVPELSRASVKKTPANDPLFAQLAHLSAASLHKIRDLGLLTDEFLGVLPNSNDKIPEQYQPIHDAIVNEMISQPLTPTRSRSHAPAKQLLQAGRLLKDLLTDADLRQLLHIDGKPPYWATGSGLNISDQDRFLTGLRIIRWDIQNFVEKLSSPGFQQWLRTKSVDWHQQMYALLFDYYNGLWRNEDRDRIKKLPIVRLSGDSYSTGDKCYFPSAGVDSDPKFPRVDQRVYSSGNNKTQQEKARKLLETMGIREVGEADQVQSILRQRYTKDATKPDDQMYLNDLKRFILLVEAQPMCGGMFRNHYIFKRAGSDWGIPEQVVLDQPYLDTGLVAYYNAVGPDANIAGLSDWYQSTEVSVQQIRAFAQATGVLCALRIETGTCEHNAYEDHLYQAKGRKRESGIDRDYYIPWLYKVIDAKNERISRLIWKTMYRDSAGKLEAMYSKSNAGEIRKTSSNLVQWLDNHKWIPQRFENQVYFVLPRRASRGCLPDGFTYDEGSEWLNAIHFGEDEKQQSEDYRQKQAKARELGFPDYETAREGVWFAELSSEEQRRIKEDYQRRQIALPEDSSNNLDLRAKRVADGATEAPPRITEKRIRTVSVGREAVKQETEPYLTDRYTDLDGQMFCQVCKAPLPFKLDDGSYYFEMVEFLREPDLRKRYYQNYLALCPNHAAMYKHANGSIKEMKARFLEMEGCKLPIVLAQKDETIYFTKKHLFDLRIVIAEDAGQTIQGHA